MASQSLVMKLSPEQLDWLRRGGRRLIRDEVRAMLDAPERYGTQVLRWCLLLPTDILVSILDREGEGTHYYFDEDDPIAEVYYQKNLLYFEGTEIEVRKGRVRDLYGLSDDEVYLHFDYRGTVGAIRQRILKLLEEMPQVGA